MNGDSAARFHVSALNGSGKIDCRTSAGMMPLLATIVPPHWLQFSLSSKWRTNSTPAFRS